ncbi:uncharacterized protein [Haliotis asinina]|uniref:uncharacterized protein n=1 Tax=Haliotis asinina TaxID=109174 RepID=UPI00353238BC
MEFESDDNDGMLVSLIDERFRSAHSMHIYDLRGKSSIIFSKPSKLYHSASFLRDIKKKLAKSHGVSEEFIYICPEREKVVIHNNLDNLVIFINFPCDFEVRSLHYARYNVGCVGLPPDCSILTMKSVIRENERFHNGKPTSLFYKGKRIDDDSLTIGSLFKNGDYVSCFVSSNEAIECFHTPKQNVQNKYTMMCSPTSSIGEMKRVFKKQFWQEFPGLRSRTDDVWFSTGKHLAKEDEYYCFDQQKRMSLQERGRLVVHVKPVDSFPITVKFEDSGAEHTPKILLVSSPMTTAALREEISSLAEYQASALRLFIKNKRLREVTLSEKMGFRHKCVVTAKVTKKMHVFIKLKEGGQVNSFDENLFKLDTVQHLKEIIQEHMSIPVLQQQMFFEEKEMQNANLIQDYHIRSEDTIHVNVFQEPVYLSVRQPGRETLHLTLNYKQSTIGKIKHFLANQFGSHPSKISIIHNSRCLEDKETLEESGLDSGSTVLIPRVAQLDETERTGILAVYIAKEDGSFEKTLAVEAGKFLFYAPDSIPSDVIERRLTESVAPVQEIHGGIMVRVPPETPRPFQHELCYKNEVDLCTTQSGSGSSKSSSESLMQGISSLSVHANASPHRTIPNKMSFPYPDVFEHHSDPEPSQYKMYKYSKVLTETPQRIIIHEQSKLDVPKGDGVNGFACIARSPSIQSTESMMAVSPQHSIHRSPSLQFPVSAIPDCLLQEVSRQLGHEWRRVALALGLENKDIEHLEYKYSRNLHEQALQALLLWKMRRSKDATIAELKRVLRECDLALIADSMDVDIKYASA